MAYLQFSSYDTDSAAVEALRHLSELSDSVYSCLNFDFIIRVESFQHYVMYILTCFEHWSTCRKTPVLTTQNDIPTMHYFGNSWVYLVNDNMSGFE